MPIRVTQQSRPARHRRAIAFCCDARYLPFAALAANTILRFAADHDFDLAICSTEALEYPAALPPEAVRMCRIDPGDALDGLRVSNRFSATAYLRLTLAEAFAADYQRVLYLDSDTMCTGPGAGKALDLDLLGRPFGAVSDNLKWKRPRRATPDQRAAGVNGPYLNSGVLLMDTAAFMRAGLREGCIATANAHQQARLHFDQTLLNIAGAGQWAELHPAWNWQWARTRIYYEMLADVQFMHFIGDKKPWWDPKGGLPPRYRARAKEFLQRHDPDGMYDFGPPDKQLRAASVAWTLVKHMERSGDVTRLLNRFGPDITRTLLPEDHFPG